MLVIAGLGWWVMQVSLLDSADRGNASSHGQFVLAAVGLLIILGDRIKKDSAPVAVDLDQLSDMLAGVTGNQWREAAADRRLVQPRLLPIRWRRATLPVAGPVAAATGTPAGLAEFVPLPGLKHVTETRLRAGTIHALHSIYGGLPSGRLLVTGAPGAGKSSAAILLLLDALDYRKRATPPDRAGIPVPVMFTFHGWDPGTVSVIDWLVTKLTEIPLFGGRHGAAQARQMLSTGRIAVFLDGLDELTEPLRPLALQALSERALFRLVVFTRSSELVDVAHQHALIGAVALELQPLTARDVADYLLRSQTDPAPAAWQQIATALTSHPTGALAQALTTPLMVGLLRDIYPPTGPVDELLNTCRFPSPDDITHHLLDNIITATYTRRPGQPRSRYTPQTAHRTLTYLAHHLNQHHTHDLAWWHVSNWLPRTPRILPWFFTILGGSFIGTALVPGVPDGIPARIRIGQLFKWYIPYGLMHAVSTLATLEIFHAIGFSREELGVGLPFLLLAVLANTLPNAFQEPGLTDTSSPAPVEVWRSDIIAHVAAWLTIALTAAVIVAGILSGGHSIMIAVIAFVEVFISGLMLGCIAWLAVSASGNAAVAHAYLTIRHRTPLRLIRFLEDARSRHLLRTVGPIYQFRHATLQDRLTATKSTQKMATT